MFSATLFDYNLDYSPSSGSVFDCRRKPIGIHKKMIKYRTRNVVEISENMNE